MPLNVDVEVSNPGKAFNKKLTLKKNNLYIQEIKTTKMDSLNDEQKSQIAQARAQALSTAEQAFNDLDGNGDGEVTLTEVLQAGSPNVTINEEILSQAKMNEELTNMMSTFDADGDGKIQKTEWL